MQLYTVPIMNLNLGVKVVGEMHVMEMEVYSATNSLSALTHLNESTQKRSPSTSSGFSDAGARLRNASGRHGQASPRARGPAPVAIFSRFEVFNDNDNYNISTGRSVVFSLLDRVRSSVAIMATA